MPEVRDLSLFNGLLGAFYNMVCVDHRHRDMVFAYFLWTVHVSLERVPYFCVLSVAEHYVQLARYILQFLSVFCDILLPLSRVLFFVFRILFVNGYYVL